MANMDPGNFIEDIVEEELASGKVKEVITRFPPEPNGYLHIGHAKAVCIDFGIAAKYGGRCNLRYDDTNPSKEDVEYVNSIKEDIAWLGFKWDAELYASDYFDRMYDCAVELIKKGLAYVCDYSAEEIRATRGTLTSPGSNSPWRERSVEENLRLFAEMKEGKYADGEKVLRAKIDMASPNINMRDPVIYRILRATHHRTGDKWCIYPMYDFAHPLEDAFEGVTHSICTLEFEDHRPLYDWVKINCGFVPGPRQIEFARLNIKRTIMSKRYLKKLVDEGKVEGWSDPRMPTLSGMRERGYPPEAIRARDLFIDRSDFAPVPPPKYKRLVPGGTVRLKGAYILQYLSHETDENGNVTEIKCEYIPESKQGGVNAGMKVKGVIQWVNAHDCIDVTLNEFDYLLLDGEGDFNDRLTPESKKVITGAKAEAMLKDAKPYDRFQFMRMGYYSAVKGYGEGKYEFNMITGLKDGYGK